MYTATSAEQRIQYMPIPHWIPKIIIFLDLKDLILLGKDLIHLWLVYYGYQKTQAKRAVQLYHALLAIADKDRLYKELKKPNSEICILFSSNALAYGTNIPDFDCVMQYCMHKDKSVNIMWQWLRHSTCGSDWIGEAIFLIKDWYKGPCKDITGPAKNHSCTGRAFWSQLSQFSHKYHVKQEILQEVLQEDRAADFASNISLKVSVCSNTNSNPPASDVGQELSLSETSVVLPVADILPKKPAWHPKTETEKRAALSHYMYALVNEEKGCL